MRIASRFVVLAIAAALFSGCDQKKTDPSVSVAANPTASAQPEIQPSATATTKPAEAPAGELLAAHELIQKFKANQKAWLDKEVTVTGQYFGSNYSGSGGAHKLNNIQVVASKDETNTTITCETSDEEPVKTLKQYDAIKVSGKVREFFKAPSLTGCRVVK